MHHYSLLRIHNTPPIDYPSQVCKNFWSELSDFFLSHYGFPSAFPIPVHFMSSMIDWMSLTMCSIVKVLLCGILSQVSEKSFAICFRSYSWTVRLVHELRQDHLVVTSSKLLYSMAINFGHLLSHILTTAMSTCPKTTKRNK